jgi:hypothetical protein
MRRVADDDPRWRQSAFGYGCNAVERMDPPPRSLAAEAYDCFMVGTLYGFNRIQAWFARLIAANGRLPSDHRAANRPDRRQPAAVLASSRTSLRRRRRSAVLDRRCARRRRANMAVGTEECLAARGRTKEWNAKDDAKWRDFPLDKESPIQAEPRFRGREAAASRSMLSAVPVCKTGNP